MIAEPTATAAPRSSEQNESAVEVHSAGALNHSGDEAGNENRQKSVRGKRRAREGSENVKRRHAKASRGSASRAESGRGKHGDVEAVTLFEVVTMGRSAMQAVVDDWIEAYVMDRDSALLDLISFFIQCSGCKGVVTAEMFHSRQDSDVMSKMVEKLDEGSGLQYKKFLAFPWILTVTWPMDIDSGEYPLTMSGPYWRRFRSEFCEFVSVLVSQSQYSVIFDSYLMDTVISLLTELSNSCVRAFRHTCTLAAVKLLSSLMGVALSLSVGVENSQRLYEVEKNKTTGRRSTPRLERIHKKITELQEKRVEIENMMDTIFKGVFLKRYRDVLPEIRSMCMEELAVWMKLYSSVFLTDSYLKYVGWMMHDKQPDVRLKCVLGLQGLYGDPLLLPKLDLFTSRFKERILTMTLDKDSEVSLQTMRLLALMSKSCDDVLSPEAYKQLFQLVYCSQRPLAVTAGELLYTRLLKSPGPASSDPQDGANEKDSHTEQTAATLRELLHFYQESELHKHVVYLVDSLWDCAGVLLKDWPTLTSLLLQDPSPQSTGLTQAEQAVVVEILVASVRQTTEGPVLPGRNGGKRVMSAREKKVHVDDCGKLTEHFLMVLPQLLSKYSENTETVAFLIKIPQYFQPESPAAENTQLLSGLLAEMGAVVELHSDPAVLEAAARSYLSLCGEGTGWHSLGRPARDTLVQRWTDRLAALLADSLKDDTFSADEEKTGEILATLKKFTAFHNGQDLSRWNLFELLSPLFSVDSTQGGVPPQVLVEALQCVCFSLLWNLNTSGGTLTSREKAVAQRNQLTAFCEKNLRCLSHSDHSVREQAFLSLCDVLTAHNFQLHVWDPTSYGPLRYTPNPKLLRALLTFIQDHVFVEADNDSHSRVSKDSEVEKLEELHKRRNLLAAYCKLIVHGVLEMSMAAEIFKYYMKHYNDFGDIIKETLSRTRQMDKIESARTLVLCLQQLFQRLKEEQASGGRCGSGVQTFSSIKELARRFSLTFGWDQIKSRESVAMIHRDGIEFVFHGFVPNPDKPYPPFLAYLTILSEFSSKLLKPDKRTVYTYLQRYTGEQITSHREDYWQPLIYYRASLLAVAEGEDAVSYVSSDRLANRSRSPSIRPSSLVEGNKSPSLFSHTDTKGKKASSNSSPQEKKTEVDPSSVATDTPAKTAKPEGPAHVASDEVDVDTVDVVDL